MDLGHGLSIGRLATLGRGAAVPPWVLSGAAIDLDFAGARYYGGLPDTLLSNIRSGAILLPDSAGVYSSSAGDSLPIGTGLGLLNQPARTNSIRNNSMQGVVPGTPGVMPTGWGGSFAGGGITQQLVGVGVDDGVSYIDVRLYGTTTGLIGVVLSMELLANTPATTGSQWVLSAIAKLVAGAIPTQITFDLALRENDSSSVFLRQSLSSMKSATSSWSRISTPAITLGASTAYIQPALRFGAPGAGVVVDFTVRIGLPQLELGAYATSPIATSGAPVSRNGDVISLIGAARDIALSSTGWVVAEIGATAQGLGAYEASAFLLGGSGASDYYLRQGSGGATTLQARMGGASIATATIGGSASLAANLVKAGLSWNASGFNVAANNGTVASLAQAPVLPADVYLMSRNSSVPSSLWLRRLTMGRGDIGAAIAGRTA